MAGEESRELCPRPRAIHSEGASFPGLAEVARALPVSQLTCRIFRPSSFHIIFSFDFTSPYPESIAGRPTSIDSLLMRLCHSFADPSSVTENGLKLNFSEDIRGLFWMSFRTICHICSSLKTSSLSIHAVITVPTASLLLIERIYIGTIYLMRTLNHFYCSFVSSVISLL